MIKKTKTKTSIGLKPLGDRLILKEIKEKEKSVSGIYIPETAKDDKNTKLGVVIAVGDGKFEDGKLTPVRVSVGERVLYQWGDTLTYGGEEFVIVRESEIIALLK